MPNRWFTGVLLFALGFGSAMLMQLPSTQAASKEGVVEGNLKYVNVPGGNFQLIYSKPNKADVFLAVWPSKRTGGQAAEKQVILHRGKVTFGKEQRNNLMLYRVTSVMKVTANVTNPCDGPVLCTFPPEPGPPLPGPRPQEPALDQYTLEFLVPDLARRPGF